MTPDRFTRQKDSAQILTKPYVESGGKCRMEFYYYMNSVSKLSERDPGVLNVFLMQSEEGDKVSIENEKIIA